MGTDSGSEHEDHDIRPFMKSSAFKSLLMENDDNLDMANNRGVNKKKKIKVLQEMIDSKDSKTSRTQKQTNKVFKEQPLMKDVMNDRKKLKRKQNLAKFNKIKIKKQKV